MLILSLQKEKIDKANYVLSFCHVFTIQFTRQDKPKSA